MAQARTICLSLVLVAWTSVTTGQMLLGPAAGICENMKGGQCQSRVTGCSSGFQPAEEYIVNNPWVCGPRHQCCVPATGSSDTCGLRNPVSQSRILNGRPTSQCDWPFLASVRARRAPYGSPLTLNNTQHSCSAVILNDQWVLTHPLCCYLHDGTFATLASNLVVVAGEYDVNQVDIDPATGLSAEQVLQVSQCYVHPQWYRNLDGSMKTALPDIDVTADQLVNGNAVALIKLAQPIQQSNCASQACLPSADPYKLAGCGAYQGCIYLGWGYNTADYTGLDPIPLAGRANVYRGAECDFLAQNAFVGRSPKPAGNTCIYPTDGTDVCVGDQGGPVLCYDGVRFAVQGIIPFRWCEGGGVANPWIVDVSEYEEWIQTTMATN